MLSRNVCLRPAWLAQFFDEFVLRFGDEPKNGVDEARELPAVESVLGLGECLMVFVLNVESASSLFSARILWSDPSA